MIDSTSLRQIQRALNSLSRAILDLHRIHRSIGQLRAVYAELWVACELKKHSPQIGDNRYKYDRGSNADIYLSDIDKRVEVKATDPSMAEDAEYAWSISPHQVENKLFDYLVLIGFDLNEPLKIQKVFIFSSDELRGKIKPRSDFMRGTYGIAYYGTKPASERYLIDRILNEHPQRFESKWDKIGPSS